MGAKHDVHVALITSKNTNSGAQILGFSPSGPGYHSSGCSDSTFGGPQVYARTFP